MEVDTTDSSPENTPLPLDTQTPPCDNSFQETSSLENQVRRIIAKRRAIDSSELRKKLHKEPTENPDPRLVNKYHRASKPPFIIHIERITPSPPLHPNLPVQDLSPDLMQSVAGGKKSNQKSSTGVYGTITFGKRIVKFIDSFKAAFDLKTIGKNKFSVSFSDGTLANLLAYLMPKLTSPSLVKNG